MNDSMDMHRLAFKEEAHELLAELETSLLEWEEQPDNKDLIGRIFRAMHTIKGSGAMFGFDDIAAFTHEVETALDLCRSGRLPVTPNLIDLTLSARDAIKAMVDAVDGGEPPLEEDVKALLENLRKLTRISLPATTSEEPNGVFESQMDDRPASLADRPTLYRIRFRPSESIFRQGTDPIQLLRELRELGETRITAHLDEIPDLDIMEPDACYVYWDMVLSTNQSLDAIRDVFIFVEDESEILIEALEGADEFDQEEGPPRLGEILVGRGDLDPSNLNEILEKRPLLGEMLVDAGMVSADRIESALMEQQEVRSVRETRRKAVEGSSIRVPAGRLDKLVDLVGELVTVQARLSQASGRLGDEDLRSVSEEVERLTAELRDNAMSTRMVPIGALFGRFKRLVRDLSHELGKGVEMVLSGEETELDKTMIERLNDPLVHLIRNSIDHGIEPPAIRQAKGKPGQGVLRVSAVHSGANVLIKVHDDGAGIDARAIRAKAIEKGLIGPEAELTDQAAMDLIFAAGFSTSDRVTGVSGRGVGMDVVKKNIEALKGTIELSSVRDAGTEITLKLPLTLAIIDGLLVAVANNYFVIPISSIEECVELTQREMARAQGRKTVVVRNDLVPYIGLRERFNLNGRPPAVPKIIIVNVDSRRVGLVVDRVIGDHQTVIKSLGPVFKWVTDVSGATILGDGSVALILDVHRLVRDAEKESD